MFWQEHRNNINSNNSSSSNGSEDSNRISMERERTCFWFIICWWGLAACTAVVSHTRASWVSHIPHSGTNIGRCVLMDSDRLMVHVHACVYTYMSLPLYNSTRKIHWYHLCVSFFFCSVTSISLTRMLLSLSSLPWSFFSLYMKAFIFLHGINC